MGWLRLNNSQNKNRIISRSQHGLSSRKLLSEGGADAKKQLF